MLAVAALAVAVPLSSNAQTERKRRFEPPLLFGIEEPPLEPRVETDPRLPVGSEIGSRSRPAARPPACSFRAPVCVHATDGVADAAVLPALDALENVWHRLVRALELPPPLADGGRGSSDALDLYLVPSERTARGFERVRVEAESRRFGGFDAAPGFCVASADPGALAERAATLCVAEAIALRLDPGETPHTRRAFATELWWLTGAPTSLDFEAVDAVQRTPWRAVLDRELSARSEGSAILFDFLELSLGVGSPGALSTALFAASAQITPAGAASWHNEPDAYDVLLHTLDESEHRMASTLGDFAVARAFGGERDDGRHPLVLEWAGAYGVPEIDWVIPFSKLPKRVRLTPVEPTGAAFVLLELEGEQAGKTLAFQAEWEPPAEFRFELVKLDADGNEMGRIEVPFQERERKVEARIVDLAGARSVLVVGTHLERVDMDHPFDPDVAPFEPHAALVYLVEL
ncbi:MAG TPA: hypothetical protein VFZ53_15070 [Polyangiaceae bacterium]